MEYIVKEYDIYNRIEEIREHIENQKWQSVLLLSLTLPDICGKLLCIDQGIVLKTGERYEKWFNEYCKKHYPIKKWKHKDDGNMKQEIVDYYFTEKMCYKLRCAVTHEGSDDIVEDMKGTEKRFEYDFRLVINGTDEYIAASDYNFDFIKSAEESNKKFRSVKIDVARLCNILCDEAEKYLSEYKEPEIIKNYSINFTDNEATLRNIRIMKK